MCSEDSTQHPCLSIVSKLTYAQTNAYSLDVSHGSVSAFRDSECVLIENNIKSAIAIDDILTFIVFLICIYFSLTVEHPTFAALQAVALLALTQQFTARAIGAKAWSSDPGG